MNWARSALAAGLLVLCAGFGLGVQPVSASLEGQTFSCGTALPTSWLVSGSRAPASTLLEPQQQACAAELREARALAWSLLGVGAVLGLVGWTAVREQGPTTPVRPGQGPAGWRISSRHRASS